MKASRTWRLSVISLLTATACAGGGARVEDYNGLVDRLRADGATVEAVGPINQPFFSVPGRVISVSGVEVQVFEYTDEAGRQAEAATITADGSSVGTSMITWVEPPHFYSQGRLIVLYVGTDSDTQSRLERLLGAPIAEGVSSPPGY